MATKPRKGGGGELFYVDEHGNKQDAALHEEILRDGDHAAAKAVSDKIRARILITATEADIAALMATRRKSPGR